METNPQKTKNIIYLCLAGVLSLLMTSGIKVRCIGCTTSDTDRYIQCQSIIAPKSVSTPSFPKIIETEDITDEDIIVRLVDYSRSLTNHIDKRNKDHLDNYNKFNNCMTK